MEVVPLKNNLLCDFRFNEVKAAVIKQLTEKSLIESKYKLDTEFLNYLTNLIEFLVNKKDKINKKDLALDIFKNMFGANEDELELISKNIEYLHSNKFIKKVSFWKMIKCGLKEWFFQKKA